MLAAASFNDELARYQTSNPTHREIIGRWRATAGIEAAWNRIQQTARAKERPDLDPREFIQQVLTATRSVKPILDDDKAVKADFEDCRNEIVEVIRGCNSPLELLRVLGWEPDCFGVYLQDAQERLRMLAKSGVDFHRPSLFGRKDQNGSRDRAAFSRRMTRYLRERCGHPCYEFVAELASIVFDRDMSADQMRRRPTTSARRSKKR